LSRETFWPDDQKTRDQRLPRSLAMVMTALMAARIIGILSLLGLGGWLALSVVGESRGDPLRLLPEMVNSKQAELTQLRENQQYLTLWEKILTPRSQASSTMDFFLALVPEGHEVICDRLRYGMKQVEVRQGAADKGSGGFLRQWSIEGSCTDQGRDHLERLREGSTISSLFAATALRLTDPSFAMVDTRAIKVVLREETNPQFDNKGTALPYQFHLEVTQSFASSDPLAIPMMPKPKPAKVGSS
jgi:hypothetical protein